MSPFPSRATAAGRAFNDLRNLALRQDRSTDELLVFYLLERFLYRVSRSRYAESLILKGGLLLTVLDARRATRDADLLARRVDGDESHVLALVAEIAAIAVDDGVVFDVAAVRAQPIRQDDFYGGVRVTMPAAIGQARVKLALDVNFGDPVTPGAVTTAFPQLLAEESFLLLGYPLETVLAEKTTTMLALGDLNTRDRDWADVWRLISTHPLDGQAVSDALYRTATHRGVALRRLSEVIERLPQVRQQSYAAWRRRQSADATAYPTDFAEVVQQVLTFVDPPLAGTAVGWRWSPEERRWQ